MSCSCIMVHSMGCVVLGGVREGEVGYGERGLRSLISAARVYGGEGPKGTSPTCKGIQPALPHGG